MHPENESDHTKIWAKWFFISAWLIVLGLGSWGFESLLSKFTNPNQQVNSRLSSEGIREVVLQRNRYGHYRATGMINGKEVEFMLDTGASDVSIPAHLGKRLALKAGAASTYHTANGPITAYHTVIDEISIGNIVLRRVRASLNPAVSDSTILVGMSFLKQLEFTQKGKQLILRQ